MNNLGELATLIRSKNAGPFVLTFDVLFDDRSTYEAVRDCHALSAGVIAPLFGLKEGQVRVFDYEPGLAFKITIPRPIPCGDPADPDIYGAQQHAALVLLPIPLAGQVEEGTDKG